MSFWVFLLFFPPLSNAVFLPVLSHAEISDIHPVRSVRPITCKFTSCLRLTRLVLCACKIGNEIFMRSYISQINKRKKSCVSFRCINKVNSLETWYHFFSSLFHDPHTPFTSTPRKNKRKRSGKVVLLQFIVRSTELLYKVLMNASVCVHFTENTPENYAHEGVERNGV